MIRWKFFHGPMCREYRGQMVEALGKMIARGAIRVDIYNANSAAHIQVTTSYDHGMRVSRFGSYTTVFCYTNSIFTNKPTTILSCSPQDLH